MKALLVLGFFLALISLFTATPVCPLSSPCSCWGNLITCQRKHLTTVPIFQESSGTYSGVYLQNNDITRLEDNAFANLKFAQKFSLTLSNNRISYISDNAFTGLENTSVLINLMNNTLTSLPKAFMFLNNVTLLYISGLTSMDGAVMRHIGHTLKILDLDLSAMEQWPSQMAYLTNLEHLTLTGLTTVKIPAQALKSSSQTLKYLILRNSLLFNISDSLCDLKSLVTLDIDNITLHPLASTMLSCSEPLALVDRLLISYSNLGFPAILSTFPNLQMIDFINNNATTIDDDLVPENNSITSLSLKGNGFSSVPKLIKKLKKLEFLSLSKNRIMTLDDHAISDFPNLKILDLSENPIKSISEFAFSNCPSLYSLELGNTFLTTLPRAVTQLSRLARLDLTLTEIECDCHLAWLANRRMIVLGLCANMDIQIAQYLSKITETCEGTPIVG